MLKVYGIAEEEKKILVIDLMSNENGEIPAYHDGRLITITNEERKLIRETPKASDFMIITKPTNFKGSLECNNIWLDYPIDNKFHVYQMIDVLA